MEAVGACQQCQKGQGCGLGLSRFGNGHVTFALSDIQLIDSSGQTRSELAPDLLQPGNKVALQLPKPQLMGFILQVLFLPAALVITLAALGHHLAPLAGITADGGALAGMIVAGIGGLILARYNCNKSERRGSQYRAQLILPASSGNAIHRSELKFFPDS